VLSRRQRVILRQILSPPYIYRWAGLLTVMAMFAGASAVVLSDVQVGSVLATGRGTSAAAEDAPARPAPAAAAPTPVPRAPAIPAAAPTLLSSMAGGARTVALTFDDGPDPASTPAILDLLAEHHISATFCMVGQQALAHPDLVRRVVAEGHRLCNHTFTHDAGIALRPPEVMDEQLRASRDALVRVAGPDVPIPYFRAPEGVWSTSLERTAAQEGMRPLGWSVDTLDWTRPGTDAIVTSVKRGLHPGAVVLFHDGGGPRDQTVAAVRQLLPWLADQKYSSVLPA
jgi:peptidoglycan/xylan/chitin deacetylase (PgdA/CDA1 family)